MALKANGAINTLKPKPMQASELRSCAEATNCGAMTIMYGRVTAFIKMLSGARNPVFVALRWGHVHFIPTYYVDEATRETLVRARFCHGLGDLSTCACCMIPHVLARESIGPPRQSFLARVRVICFSDDSAVGPLRGLTRLYCAGHIHVWLLHCVG